MSDRPPIDADIRLIWQYIDATEDAVFGRPSISVDLTPEDWKALARVKVEKVPPGRRAPSEKVFAERLQMTRAEKTAILLDALERQIAQRDKDLIAAQKKQQAKESETRRKHGLVPRRGDDIPRPWRRIAARLESEWVSRDFRRVVALLIRSNVFSTNGMLPSALDREDAKRAAYFWRQRVKDHFADVPEQQRENLACRLVALEHLMELDGILGVSQIADWDFYNKPLSSGNDAQSRLTFLADEVRSSVAQDGGDKPLSRKMRSLLNEVHRAEIIDAP